MIFGGDIISREKQIVLILALCIALLNANAIYAQSNDNEIHDIPNNIENYDENLEDTAISDEFTKADSTEPSEVTSHADSEGTSDTVSSQETLNSDEVSPKKDQSNENSATSNEENSEYKAAGSQSSSITPYGAIYVRADGMNTVNFAQLKKAGVTDIFLNFRAFDDSQYSTALNKFLKDSQDNGIRVSVWVQAFQHNGQWINPTAPGSQQYIQNFLTRMENYTKRSGVGGIHLDYVRYPGSGSNIAGTAGTTAITNFVKQVNEVVKAVNPNALVSAALMPEGMGNAHHYGQDYAQLAKHLDVLVPMIYRGNYQQSVDWINLATRYIVEQANGTDRKSVV